MNEIRPEDVLARLDWQTLTCQSARGCKNPAKYAMEIHAIDCCDAQATNDFGNVVVILCKPCYAALIRDTNRLLGKLAYFGRPHCMTCHAPLRATTDALRAAVAL
ncbi:hypothetical protein ABW16_01830 [Mycolicibacter heraklionensis]|uniref:Uncharacterized protein n=1 Tax=Mycolicibacter heraklionensis TaxID=512402 RepID=A0ABR5FKQ4_9MYCO|nr:hypothetical protein [Mycolicibacter heraklionensis]KLO31597.1 hypothetical protein ABW16_01830 [Mycolicibacter heraklionensis]